MNSLSYKLKLSTNLKIMIAPLAVIVVVLLFGLVFAPKGIATIQKKMQDYKSTQKEEAVLDEKVQSLKKIDPKSLDPEDITVVAHPSKNPAIWLVAHVRRLSQEYEIEIPKLTMERPGKAENLEKAAIEIEVEAKEYRKLLSFMNDYIKVLPVTSLNTVSVKRKESLGGDVYSGGVKTSFYWSDFPENLPPMTQPINELTSEDLNTMRFISGYKQPSFIELEPGEPKERQQPFN